MNQDEKIVDALVSLIGYRGWSVCAGVVTYYHDALSRPTMLELEAEIQRRAPIIAAEKARQEFAANRQAQVDALTVEVNGNIYDANETAQRRMKGAADAARRRGSLTVPLWVMADNSVVYNVLVDDLEEAHARAFEAMAAIWVPV